MSTYLLFWTVVRDGRGKWTVIYDPKQEVKDGKRFAFETYAIEYKKKMEKADAAARLEAEKKQRTLL